MDKIQGQNYIGIKKQYERQVFPSLHDKQHHSTTSENDDFARKYASNKIRTALYTRLSLYPVAFMLQFTRVANVYWGIATMLQFYKVIRTAEPLFSLFFLSVVIHVGIFKEWMSDSKRQKADRLVNKKGYSKVVKLENNN